MGQLFDPDEGKLPPELHQLSPGERTVRILPDVSGIDKHFDYVVPANLVDRVSVGTLVRVELHGRRVAGWVIELDPEIKPGLTLRPIVKVSSVGPDAETVDLARWTALRWCGRLAAVMRSASPPKMVANMAKPRSQRRPSSDDAAGEPDDTLQRLATEALSRSGGSTVVLRVPPSQDQRTLLLAAAAMGNVLILIPEVARVHVAARFLKHRGYRVHVHPDDWANGPSGGVVVGSRSAVWAPTAALDAIVVIDEHDESFQDERVPTWNARDVAIERARRAEVPCLLTSPALSLAALEAADTNVEFGRKAERAGWPIVEVVDQRLADPGRPTLFSERVAAALRDSSTAVLILNRKGRARMLACGQCGELVRTEDGEHLMAEDAEGMLTAASTGEQRPKVCAVCGGTTLKRLRLGVTRAAEELHRLTGREVLELTSSTVDRSIDEDLPLVLGTEAALFSRRRAELVVFLDFDQELLAPRYRAAEQSMWLLARASRLVGARSKGGRVIVQTRTPDHRVLRAAVRAAPSLLVDEERAVREPLGLPPFGALAEISGAGAAAFVAAFEPEPAITVLGPRADGRYLLRCDTAEVLSSALNGAPRPKDRVRIAVDPSRV